MQLYWFLVTVVQNIIIINRIQLWILFEKMVCGCMPPLSTSDVTCSNCQLLCSTKCAFKLHVFQKCRIFQLRMLPVINRTFIDSFTTYIYMSSSRNNAIYVRNTLFFSWQHFFRPNMHLRFPPGTPIPGLVSYLETDNKSQCGIARPLLIKHRYRGLSERTMLESIYAY